MTSSPTPGCTSGNLRLPLLSLPVLPLLSLPLLSLLELMIRHRYQCGGGQMLNRTEAYFEYPSVAAMMIREVAQ